MSEKRRYAYRRLDDVSRLYIETRLALGHTPKAIRDAYNGLISQTPEQITRVTAWKNRENEVVRNTVFSQIAGRPEVNLEDVRRVYDALRKRGGGQTSENQRRRRELQYIQYEEDTRRVFNPGIQKGSLRKAVDAGMIYRTTKSADAASAINEMYPNRVT